MKPLLISKEKKIRKSAEITVDSFPPFFIMKCVAHLLTQTDGNEFGFKQSYKWKFFNQLFSTTISSVTKYFSVIKT